MIQSKTAHTGSMAKVTECTIINLTERKYNHQTWRAHAYIRIVNTTLLYLPKKDLVDHGEPLAKCCLAHSWEFQSGGYMKVWQMALML